MANQNRWTIWRVIALPFKILSAVASFILALFALGILIVVLVASSEQQGPVSFSNDSVLVLNPSGILAESAPQDSFFDLFRSNGAEAALNPQQISVRDVVKTIDNAAEDKRIHAIFLRLDELSGINTIFAKTIGDALKRFSKTGKRVIAFGFSYDQSRYLLASYADEVTLHPMGDILILGYSRIRSYFLHMLKKLGIKVHLFRTGDFKSAAEPFIRDNMSKEDQAASHRILNTFWSAYAQQIADNRSLNVADLNKFIENPVDAIAKVKGDFAKLALDLRWADKLMTESEAREHTEQLVSDEKVQFVQFQEYLASIRGGGEQTPSPKKVDGEIGLIIAEGQIVDQTFGQDEPVIVADPIISQIETARKDDDIKALVVRMSTPGGSPLASERIRLALEKFQESGKPVVISMGSVAASGGYWIASTADEIWASDTTLTGSIGVFALIPTFEDASKKIGLGTDGVQKGTLSGLALTKPLPQAFERIINLRVQHTYSQFLKRVAIGRNLSIEAVKKLAQGQIWMGGAAMEKGLVDHIGDLDAAFESAAARTNLTNWKIRKLKAPKPWWHELKNLAEQSAIRGNGTAGLLNSIAGWLTSTPFRVLLRDPAQPYVLCLGCSAYIDE